MVKNMVLSAFSFRTINSILRAVLFKVIKWISRKLQKKLKKKTKQHREKKKRREWKKTLNRSILFSFPLLTSVRTVVNGKRLEMFRKECKIMAQPNMFASAGNENKRKQVDKRITITANIINQEFLPSIVASLLSRLACEQRWLPGQQFLLFANVMLVASHLPRVPSRICDFIFRGCFWHGSFCNIA